MKKKIALIMTVVLVAASMMACGKGNKVAKNQESIIDTETEAVIGQTDTEDSEIDSEAVKNTEAEQPAADVAASDGTVTTNKDTGKNGGTDSTNVPKSSGNTSSNAGSTSTSAGNANTTPANTGNTSTTPETPPVHVHTWILHEGSGHYETQVVKEAWDEPVYETQAKTICNQCGADISGESNIIAHMKANAETCWGYHTEYVQVQTGTVHHDAETKQVWIQDVAPYSQCSGCGEISVVGAGITIN